MLTLRRIYLYLAFLAGLTASLNGAVQVLTALWAPGPFHSPNALASGLASLLVGVPVMVGHGLWAQRLAQSALSERTAWERAVALHLAWGVSWLVALNAGISLLQRLLWVLANPTSSANALFWKQTLIILGVYFSAGLFFALRNAQETGAAQQAVRRVHLWAWLVIAIALGTQGMFLLTTWWQDPTAPWPTASLHRPLTGVAWILASLWVAGWLVKPWRHWATDPDEQRSILHGTLTLLLALTAAGVLAASLIQWLTWLGRALVGHEPWSRAETWTLRLLVGRLLPWGLVFWLLARRWQRYEAAWEPLRGRLARARAEGLAALAGVGLLAGGAAMLARALGQAIWNGTGANALVSGVAFILTGFPLWYGPWRSLQRDAQGDETLNHAVRTSLGRRGMLYGVLLGSMLALMGALGALTYHLLLLALGGEPWPPAEWWTAVSNAIIAAAVGGIHWRILRHDLSTEETARRRRLAAFPVLLLSDGTAPLLGSIHERLRAYLPDLPVRWHDLKRGLPDPQTPLRAVVLPGALLEGLSESWRLWLQRFTGAKLILPAGGRWMWVGALDEQALADETVERLQSLATGKGPHPTERLRWRQALPALFGLVVWVIGWLIWLEG